MDSQFRLIFAVFLGGAAGTLLRVAVGQVLVGAGSFGLLAVFVVNVAGALVLGWFGERVRHAAPWSTPMVAFVGVGLLGSFTTFSAFSVESIELFQSGSWLVGLLYVTGTVGIGLIAAIQGRRFVSAP
ncbi:MAG: CrcB family protein [Actinomycetia bacterium]|nr:CrcB family protein [Actinomycetes bacterium]